MITLTDYLVVGAILFGLSLAGMVINRKNLIILLMSVELMLLAVNINFIAFASFLQDSAGQVFVFFHFDCCCCGNSDRVSDTDYFIPSSSLD